MLLLVYYEIATDVGKDYSAIIFGVKQYWAKGTDLSSKRRLLIIRGYGFSQETLRCKR